MNELKELTKTHDHFIVVKGFYRTNDKSILDEPYHIISKETHAVLEDQWDSFIEMYVKINQTIDRPLVFFHRRGINLPWPRSITIYTLELTEYLTVYQYLRDNEYFPKPNTDFVVLSEGDIIDFANINEPKNSFLIGNLEMNYYPSSEKIWTLNPDLRHNRQELLSLEIYQELKTR
ncbi:MAG: hypothetical protein R3321_03635, partial [Nitrososphaeraceae archaeon]|nr:hypothetical protein [Nitrososphaeraceae archaeon]